MPLLRLENVSLAYGHLPLLENVDLQIERGERVCLVGRNGAGKTTLLRVITGVAVPDAGEVWRAETVRIAHLEQEASADSEQSVFAVVASGLGELGDLLLQYHQASQEAAAQGAATLDRLAALQARIEARHGWNIHQRVQSILSQMNLPAERRLNACSGGIRRQVMLARALVGDPDVLLLDEPTNHLDISTITWLEKTLMNFRGGLIFITHDRTLVRHLATRIIELDRGRLTSFPGDFDGYLRKKDELLEIEERRAARFDKKLAEEEAWVRRGIKARRTRNEGRVRELERMRRERGQRLERQGRARFGIDSGALSGKLAIDVRRVSFSYGDQVIVRDLSTRILRGDRVGIIGPNGSGKSTLLKLMLGELAPTSGNVVVGTRLEVAYFDQYRQLLEPEKSVRKNVSDSDYVTVQGRSRHVIGYLKDFLFPAQRIDSPVKALSGGERNRLLLAKVFTRPANMLVLDEPTNDLDVDTLELLEDLLADYKGTLLLVTHDRAFLDNIVTSTLVFEGDGRFGEYAGGYRDWLRTQQLNAASRTETLKRPNPSAAPVTERSARHESARGLSYKEQRELRLLPERIEELESEQAVLHARLGESEFYRESGDKIAAAVERMESLTRELEECYARWQSLESRAGR